MTPVSLYGIDTPMCERFYVELTQLVSESVDDSKYSNALFSIEEDSILQNIEIADKWSQDKLMDWQEEIANEVEMISFVCAKRMFKSTSAVKV